MAWFLIASLTLDIWWPIILIIQRSESTYSFNIHVLDPTLDTYLGKIVKLFFICTLHYFIDIVFINDFSLDLFIKPSTSGLDKVQ